jgi:uncharacterized repeat protein (TIGR03803 family)
VFKLDSAGNESILYSFHGHPTDGANPYGAVLRDQAGNLYGTTSNGGASNAGTVFELSPSGSGWTEQPLLYEFTGGSDGREPFAGLIADEQGNLYGTTYGGGDLNCGVLGSCGVVFELSPSPNGTWSETVLHIFTGVPDGGAPGAALISDSAGNLYGTTSQGGIATGCTFLPGGCGTVFELSPNGSGWTENILYSFTGGADGSAPNGPVTMDPHGNLYGAAFYGGDLNSANPACFIGMPIGCGTVFELTP